MAQRIPVIENILSVNDRIASDNKARFDQTKTFSINMMASPGAGKTSLIEKTTQKLLDQIRLAVIDGDIATTIDADRASAAGATAVQINTGGECHLDAVMLQDAIRKIDLEHTDLLIVENVGNLICPINFKIGTHKNILIASIPEGDDKPYKYPGMYQGVDALVINKIDLLPYIDFDMDFFLDGVKALNPGLIIFNLSCRTLEGIDTWFDWILDQTRNMKLT